MDTSARERYFTVYKQYEALQIVYNLAKGDGRNTSTKTTNWLRHIVRSTIEQFAASECRKLANEISGRLPRELRDMIYDYTLDRDTAETAFDKVRFHELCHTPWLLQCERKRCSCFKTDEMPFYVQHEIVGLAFARGVVTAYYKFMNPERLGYNIHCLYKFLLYDHFHLGVTPAKHIRHLRLLVSPVHNAKLAMIINYNVCISSNGQILTKDGLELLRSIENKRGFRLTVVLGDGIWGPWIEQTLETLRTIYDELKNSGMRIRVYGKPGPSNDRMQRLDNYFKLSFKDWVIACREARGNSYPINTTKTASQSFEDMMKERMDTWSDSESDVEK